MRSVCRWAALLSTVAVLVPLTAAAQSVLQPLPPIQTAPKQVPSTPAAPKPPSGPSFIGTWIGDVDQVGRESTYPIVLTISTKGDTTSYADQGCSGTLTRIGASVNYVFYVEKITKGAFSAATNTGCIDGTITLAKAGNQLLFSWFGVSNGQLYQASATLMQSATLTGK
jgi:hypothetical protein